MLIISQAVCLENRAGSATMRELLGIAFDVAMAWTVYAIGLAVVLLSGLSSLI